MGRMWTMGLAHQRAQQYKGTNRKTDIPSPNGEVVNPTTRHSAGEHSPTTSIGPGQAWPEWVQVLTSAQEWTFANPMPWIARMEVRLPRRRCFKRPTTWQVVNEQRPSQAGVARCNLRQTASFCRQRPGEHSSALSFCRKRLRRTLILGRSLSLSRRFAGHCHRML